LFETLLGKRMNESKVIKVLNQLTNKLGIQTKK